MHQAHPPITFWSLTVKAGKPEDVIVNFDLRVTNACISARYLTELNYTNLRLYHEDLAEDPPTTKEATICWLNPSEVR